MHPPTLQSTRLRSSLRQYIEGYSRRSGINVDLRLGAKADTLPYEVQRTLLRIVPEGLANIHRHAAATRAAVQLRFIRGRLHLIIKDNGHGFGRATEAGLSLVVVLPGSMRTLVIMMADCGYMVVLRGRRFTSGFR